jgi:hypothetical protein
MLPTECIYVFCMVLRTNSVFADTTLIAFINEREIY